MQQKLAILCIKCKSLDINLLFIELLYKINITFVIMLIFVDKTALCAILTIWNVNIYIFYHHILNFAIKILQNFAIS